MTGTNHSWERLNVTTAERLGTRRARCRASSARGFSLLEALVVVALVGIASLFAASNFRIFARRARLEAIAREINVQVVAARAQAIKRGDDTGVEISVATAPATCWKFVDLNHSGTRDGGDLVSPSVRCLTCGSFQPATPRTGIVVKIDDPNAVAPSSTTTVHTIVFTGFGSINAAGAAKSVYIQDSFGNLLQISTPNPVSGRVEMTKLSAGAFIPRPWTWY
jgi:prepilin-type N-terminal cleavage/methylation domain-containing protein